MQSSTRLTRPVLILIAACVGLCAGSNYFNQPLLDSIAASFHVSGSVAAITVTVAQVSYAVGLVLIVPAGDVFVRRRLTLVLLLLTAAGLAISGFAGSFPILLVGLALSGVCAVAAQVLVPFAASLAEPSERAATTGTVMSGLLIGILVARSISGILSETGGGWQTIYRVATVLMLLAAVGIWLRLPEGKQPAGHPTYGQAIRSLLPLLRKYPRLATRTVLGGLTFAGASVIFASMALQLSAAPFRLNDLQIGLVGLVGVAGAIAAVFVGRGIDRGKDKLMGVICLVVLLLAWIDFATAARTGLLAFIIGMILLDLGLQGIHVANQGIIQRLDDGARSRITSVYMTGYFFGAALGSVVGAIAWGLGGWSAICLAGFVLLACTVVALIIEFRLTNRLASLSPSHPSTLETQ